MSRRRHLLNIRGYCGDKYLQFKSLSVHPCLCSLNLYELVYKPEAIQDNTVEVELFNVIDKKYRLTLEFN